MPQPLPSLPHTSSQAQGTQSFLSTSSRYGRKTIIRQCQAQREGEQTPEEPGLSGPPTLGQGGLLGWRKVASELDLENEGYGFPGREQETQGLHKRAKRAHHHPRGEMDTAHLAGTLSGQWAELRPCSRDWEAMRRARARPSYPPGDSYLILRHLQDTGGFRERKAPGQILCSAWGFHNSLSDPRAPHKTHQSTAHSPTLSTRAGFPMSSWGWISYLSNVLG